MYYGYWVFPGGKERHGVTLTPHPLLVPWWWKGTAIPLLPLWTVRPVQSLSAGTRVTFTLTFYQILNFKIVRRLRVEILNAERQMDRQTWRQWLSPFATALTDSASQHTVWTCLTNSLYRLDSAVFIHKYYSRVIDIYYIYGIIHYKYKPLGRIFCFVSFSGFCCDPWYRILDTGVGMERMGYLLCEFSAILHHQKWALSEWIKRPGTGYCIAYGQTDGKTARTSGKTMYNQIRYWLNRWEDSWLIYCTTHIY